MEKTASPEIIAVDMDGTLLNADTLYEQMALFVKRNPLNMLKIREWKRQGKAQLKKNLTAAVGEEYDVTTLPYNSLLIEFLKEKKAAGATIVLATASDEVLAQRVADHVGIFDRVFASNGITNLKTEEKARALEAAYGKNGFLYIGNSKDDLKVWPASGGGWLANPDKGVAAAASGITTIHQPVFIQPKPKLLPLRLLRVHQWMKNLLVFLPLLTGHQLDFLLVLKTVLAFIAFSLCASSVYLMNDISDLMDDRSHPRKRRRPFAAGYVSIMKGAKLIPALLILSFALAFVCGGKFPLILLAYYGATLAYTFILKKLVMIDVLALAGLYTMRILGGAAVMKQWPSFWLLAFSMFLFLSLALVKRYSELVGLQLEGKEHSSGRDYDVSDLRMLASLGGSSGYLAVLVLALYIQSNDVAHLYRHPEALWFLCPVLLYWISRTWIIAHRGKMHDDPVVFAVRDRMSQILMLLTLPFILWAI